MNTFHVTDVHKTKYSRATTRQYGIRVTGALVHCAGCPMAKRVRAGVPRSMSSRNTTWAHPCTSLAPPLTAGGRERYRPLLRRCRRNCCVCYVPVCVAQPCAAPPPAAPSLPPPQPPPPSPPPAEFLPAASTMAEHEDIKAALRTIGHPATPPRVLRELGCDGSDHHHVLVVRTLTC